MKSRTYFWEFSKTVLLPRQSKKPPRAPWFSQHWKGVISIGFYQHPVPWGNPVPKSLKPTYTRKKRFIAEEKSTGLAIPNFNSMVQSENHACSPFLWKLQKEWSKTHPILPTLTLEKEEGCSAAEKCVSRELRRKHSVEFLGYRAGFGSLLNCCGKIRRKSSLQHNPTEFLWGKVPTEGFLLF